jgi:RNA polymerase sigma factor (sigma-70 family)
VNPTIPSAASDEAVLAESLTSPDRFGEIYERHVTEVYRYIAGRLGTDAADDLTSEVFEAAFRRRKTFDPAKGTVRPWLYGIATNLIAGHHRGEARRYAALAKVAPDASVAGHEDRSVDRLTAWQYRRDLADGLAGLSLRDRDVLLLTAIGGLSYAEVSFALRIPEGTVASRLSRARKKLTASLSRSQQ